MIDLSLIDTFRFSEPAFINKILHEFRSGKKLKCILEKKKTNSLTPPKEYYFVLDDDETFVEVKDSRKKESKLHRMYFKLFKSVAMMCDTCHIFNNFQSS